MRRTWGYIVMAVGTLVGLGALLMPLPETYVVEAPEPVAQKPPAPRAAPAAAPVRPKKAAKAKPAPPPQRPVPEPIKKVPLQNTVTGGRTIAPR